MSDEATISVIETDSGRFNVIGISGDGFILQGNLSADELQLLRERISEAMFDSAQQAS